MTRAALACLILLAGCSSEPQAPAAPFPWLYGAPAVQPRSRPKAAPRPAPARKAVKKKAAPRKAERVAVPAWCSQVPFWATVDQIETAAKARGVKVTARHRAQARACLDSKKG